MFHQSLTPVGGSLVLSFIVATLPIATVLVLLGVARRPAWQASLAGLIAGLVIAIEVWQMPASLALDSAANGAVFGLWPVMWIVFNGLLVYNVAVASGRFDAFRGWTLEHLPNDRRVVLIVIGFCFGALLEGIAGGGVPVAITSSLLILVGYPAVEALTFALIFNTAPVAFGAIAVAITTLGAVTHLDPNILGSMVGRQLPFTAALLPFYVMGIYGGRRSIAALWPILTVAGASFATTQFVVSNYVDYGLTDVLSSLVSLIVSVGFLSVWKPAPDPVFEISKEARALKQESTLSTWQGWLPWVVVSAVVISWTVFRVFAIGQLAIAWPGLHNQVYVTLYKANYEAIWVFQPLASGTAILVSAVLIAWLVGMSFRGFLKAIATTWRMARLAMLTVALIVALAFVMNYSGQTYTLGLAASTLGPAFPFVSPFLGWVAVFLSGSDANGNALFGNLQVVAANQLQLDPTLMAATNASGGVLGKMISPQNIATGVSTTNLKGQEGVVLARTFKHSIILTFLLGILVLIQQCLTPWIIPH